MSSRYVNDDKIRCPCGCGRGLIFTSWRLLELLDELSEAMGRPVVIKEIYRCERYNTAVGGSLNSLHTRGLAADTLWPDGLSKADYELMVRRLSFDGVVVYDWGIHVDVRNGGVGGSSPFE